MLVERERDMEFVFLLFKVSHVVVKLKKYNSKFVQ